MAKQPEKKPTTAKPTTAKPAAAKPAKKAKSTAAGKSATKAAAKSSPSGRPRGLGRGLSSLLGDAGVAAATGAGVAGSGTGMTQSAVETGLPAAPITGLTELPIEWINSGPWQPRRRFDKDRLAAQLRSWSPEMILDAVNRLQDAELAVKTGAADDKAQCAQTLLGICLRGKALAGRSARG